MTCILPLLFIDFIASSNRQWLPRPLRCPPINPLKQHCQLRRRHRHLPAFCRRPNKPAALQTLGEQACPLLIPPNDLQEITTSPPEDEHVAAEWIFGQRTLHLRCQCVESRPHVRRASSQPNARIAGDRDHAIRPLISRASSLPSNSPSSFSRRPSGKIISNRPAPPEHVVAGGSANDTVSAEAFASISTDKNVCVSSTTLSGA